MKLLDGRNLSDYTISLPEHLSGSPILRETLMFLALAGSWVFWCSAFC
jgi:hypothetical protein